MPTKAKADFIAEARKCLAQVKGTEDRFLATFALLLELVDTVGAGAANRRALEVRTAELEQRRTMAFEGAFDPGRTYRAGDVTQRAGGLFVALAATGELPGESTYWRRIGDAR
ncbi:hypothetical protein [Piscinibacter sp.]|uniref:hypothetical protein n=1 Tax=Piscinibacter sp. TaxID=1903157 RepID=UPI002C622AB0|nr:hypothetical protein [Albitalea sp.]HUG26215.1 hypothetical protein [Albitalea sp.]